MEANTSSSTEPLLPSRALYGRSLSCIDNELRSFHSCLRWMCVDQFDIRHVVVSLSLFLLLGVFVPIASHFVLSCAPTCCVYGVVVQLSVTSTFGLSYVCLSTFAHRYSLCRFLFLDKMYFGNLNHTCHYINDLL
ncbi:hypothetical protein B296_00048804 [Ensete ventricosum]|uniref:Transmembrane protein n=1 Tax=Ensete ventricosum TaxID=4639 RepID=A0A426XV02_ENSVE|nr:hypothetical protein B296_00048804 [Ensete ventricosum]